MYKIRQYRPNFFTGFENTEATFSTKEELESIPFVNNFKQDYINHAFEKFAISADKGISRTGGNRYTLLAIMNQGRRWLVVGFIDDIDSPPPWLEMFDCSEAMKRREFWTG